ncbi:MAG TPA: polysaccharide deacetylase family protein [Planctomycetota bacterium]|nr:polysaccharide deacetylase family protein [Planctomycetota bacterium]HRR78861.1 polysaccharide deacetylase family protein [Planctomycetota bacterium]HRT92833.1 polysaccharide deacetylase family protein [Planctomycetota bacterium]
MGAGKTLLLLTVDTEASFGGARPIPPETRVYGRVAGGTHGIERIMDCCERHGVRATFFVNTLEALHHGEDHVRRVCTMVQDRGHDAQLHVHPIWLGGPFVHKALTAYGYAEQRAAIERAAELFRRAAGTEPLAHRAGGLAANADTFRALASLGIRCDSSVAVGHWAYGLGEGGREPNVPRRLHSLAEVPVTTFAQVRLCGWAPRRHFDLNADSLSELCFVVDRAAEAGVAAVTLLMHSFSFLRWSRDGSECRPDEGEVRKFERFLEHAVAHGGIEAATFRQLVARLEAEPTLLEGPDFDPTAGLVRTYRRSWERFGTGWKSKAMALGVPAAVAALAALIMGVIWWLTS